MTLKKFFLLLLVPILGVWIGACAGNTQFTSTQHISLTGEVIAYHDTGNPLSTFVTLRDESDIFLDPAKFQPIVGKTYKFTMRNRYIDGVISMEEVVSK